MLPRPQLILVLAQLLWLGCQPPPAPPKVERAPFMLGGIQIREIDLWYWTHMLKRTGMNTVSTTVYARQGPWDSAVLKETPAPWVVDEIRAARKAGLKTVLILRVALDHAYPENRFLWHGMIRAKDPQTQARWFERYEAFVLRWAEIAQREGVDVLGIGSEMGALTSTRQQTTLPALEDYYLSPEKQAKALSDATRFEDRIERRHIEPLGARFNEDLQVFLQKRQTAQARWAKSVSHQGAPDPIAATNAERKVLEKHWRALIAKVRKRYQGALTYAANFDQYDRVGFWDALDLVGINAYFKLQERPDADLTADPRALGTKLQSSWEKILADIDRVAAPLGKQVLFTELGYTYRRHSTIEPWGQTGFSVFGNDIVFWKDEPQFEQERALAVRALYKAGLAHPKLLRGLLYWKLSTIEAQLPIEPFVMILKEEPGPLQSELVRFVR